MAANNTTEAEKMVYDSAHTLSELKAIAKKKAITGYSQMNKSKLLEVLNNGD